MKTFSTSGTGNQQTLSEIETDKIPVYATDADAEADLANLSVGQIIGITDTGDELSHPVNVVEEGNLHAVSSNAVAESLSYSTTEQKTGGKWIDGKPIYRKVIENTFTEGGNQITHNLGIANYINIRIFVSNGSGGWHTNGYYNGQNHITPTSLLENTLSVTTNGNGWIGNGLIILEYTKTTD